MFWRAAAGNRRVETCGSFTLETLLSFSSCSSKRSYRGLHHGQSRHPNIQNRSDGERLWLSNVRYNHPTHPDTTHQNRRRGVQGLRDLSVQRRVNCVDCAGRRRWQSKFPRSFGPGTGGTRSLSDWRFGALEADFAPVSLKYTYYTYLYTYSSALCRSLFNISNYTE